MSTLPQIAIDMLPFSAEPMSQWKENTDIRIFADALYPHINGSSFGLERCTEEEKTMRGHARAFTKNLMESSNASAYLDFYQNSSFGQVAKYAISLQCCIQQLLEDAGFYSLAHLLESGSDMECSLLLASNFYYKQATLLLRNILEEVFLPIHFCDNVSDFDSWKASNFRTPKLRGRDGLIKRLVQKGIIYEPLATRIANLYGDLSAYAHGSENSLTYKDIHLGKKKQIEYNPTAFSTWSQLFCECSDVCVHLLKTNYEQWHAIRSFKFETLAKVGKTLCHTCHNEDKFDKWMIPSKYCYVRSEEQREGMPVIENVEDSSFYYYICEVCGQATIVNANITNLEIVLCFSTDDLPPGSAISSSNIAKLVKGTEDLYCEWYTVQPIGTDIIKPLLVRPTT